MPEAVLGMLLLAVSIVIYTTNFNRYAEIDLFAVVLLVQKPALPSGPGFVLA
jgi:hypothetical protein